MKRARPPFVVALGVALAVLVLVVSHENPGGCLIPAPHTIALAGIDAGVRPPPRPSEGCGVSAAPGTAHESLLAAGATRTFERVLPAGYDPRRPYPLVLVFHGNGNDARSMHAHLALEKAYGDGAVALYPQAVVRRVWADNYAPHWGRVDDLPFFDALVGWAEKNLCVDAARIFAVGWSSGAYFANQLGCVRPEVVRAIAATAGGGPEDAVCTRPVATFLHADRDDHAVLVTEGRASRDAWRKTNGCVASHDEDGCTIYSGCAAPLVYCETSGNGHRLLPAVRDALWHFLGSF
jgi:poly(3-hydroxybutyrate) depolymerase